MTKLLNNPLKTERPLKSLVSNSQEFVKDTNNEDNDKFQIANKIGAKMRKNRSRTPILSRIIKNNDGQLVGVMDENWDDDLSYDSMKGGKQ